MRQILAILLLVVITTSTTAEVIRGHSWDDTLDQVKQRESAKPTEEITQKQRLLLKYDTELLGKNVTLTYFFDVACKQLRQVSYIFPEELPRQMYHYITEILKEKYGESHQTSLLKNRFTDHHTWTTETNIIVAYNKDGKTHIGYSILKTASFWPKDCPAIDKIKQDLKDKL
ncbi:hypothetical protein ES702_06562 [subsurface metagenome]